MKESLSMKEMNVGQLKEFLRIQPKTAKVFMDKAELVFESKEGTSRIRLPKFKEVK
jgi:hypothetical protein